MYSYADMVAAWPTTNTGNRGFLACFPLADWKMPNVVPTEMLQPTFVEPSSASETTPYLRGGPSSVSKMILGVHVNECVR